MIEKRKKIKKYFISFLFSNCHEAEDFVLQRV